jgi:RNA recognition motif-containing protein
MKLYIGNVSYDTTERELRDALAPFEPLVDFYYPLDRESGRPRGFAFVTLSDRESGEEAIRTLDGFEIAGRKLRVSEAEERRERSGGGGGGGGGGFRSGGGGGGGGGGYRGGGGGGGGYRGGGDRDRERGGGGGYRGGGGGGKRGKGGY